MFSKLALLSVAIPTLVLTAPAGYSPIGNNPTSREAAILAWNQTNFNSSLSANQNTPPPPDLPFCSYNISSAGFFMPIIVLAVFFLIFVYITLIVMGVLPDPDAKNEGDDESKAGLETITARGVETTVSSTDKAM